MIKPNSTNFLKIREIIPADKVNMDGHFLDQPLPNAQFDQVDPFLLIHHWNSKTEGGMHPRDLGVGPHPHRGFSPVTFIYQGDIHHRDSRGNNSIIGAGGTQWMDAGFGITHSERPSVEMAKNGGVSEIIQCWINTPKAAKLLPPRYQPLTAAETPVYHSKNGQVKCQVVCGEQFGLVGPIQSQTPVLCLRLNFQKEGETEIEIPEGFNTLIYSLNGSLMLNSERRCFMKEMAVFEQSPENTHGKLHIKAGDNCDVLLLSGSPIGEPVVKYGPFVMNTQSEVMEAMRDSQMGKMGILIEDF